MRKLCYIEKNNRPCLKVGKATKYWNYKDTDYTNPPLKSNGTPYVDEFAVSDGDNKTTVWYAFNGVVDNNYTLTKNPLSLYFNKPIKITSITYVGHSDTQARYRLTNAKLYGSNDGENYTLLSNYTPASVTVSGTMDFSSNSGYYTSYRLECSWNSLGFAIYEATIKGSYKVSVPATSEDYDYTTIEDIYYGYLKG